MNAEWEFETGLGLKQPTFVGGYRWVTDSSDPRGGYYVSEIPGAKPDLQGVIRSGRTTEEHLQSVGYDPTFGGTKDGSAGAQHAPVNPSGSNNRFIPDFIEEPAEDLWDVVTDTWDVLDGIPGAVGKAAVVVADESLHVGGEVWDTVKDVTQAGIGVADESIHQFSEFVDSGADVVADVSETVADTVVDFSTTVYTGFVGITTDAAGDTWEFFSDGTKTLIGKAQDLPGEIKDVFDDPADAVIDFGGDLIDGVGDAAENVADAAKGVGNFLTSPGLLLAAVAVGFVLLRR